MKNIMNAVVHIGETQANDTQVNHIAYGIDKNFLMGTGISIVSVLINNTEKFHFHIFTDHIDQAYIEKCKNICDKFQTNITVYFLNSEVFSNFPTKTQWTKATYFRLAIFDLLADTAPKLLYLDADVVCNGDLSELFQTDLTHHYAAGMRDLDRVQNAVEQRLGIQGLKGKYFNAGVLLVNTQLWRDNNLTQQSFTMLNDEEQCKKLLFMDQDLLNILLAHRTVILDSKYNRIYDGAAHFGLRDYDSYQSVITSDTALIHYTSDTKPWLKWVRYSAFSPFDRALTASPWSTDDLLDAQTANQLKKKSKHEFYQKKYMAALQTQCRYIFKRLIG